MKKVNVFLIAMIVFLGSCVSPNRSIIGAPTFTDYMGSIFFFVSAGFAAWAVYKLWKGHTMNEALDESASLKKTGLMLLIPAAIALVMGCVFYF